MKSFSFNQLNTLFHEEHPPDFMAWKVRRTRLCSVLGPSLLLLSDNELNSVFNHWEESIKSRENSTSPPKQLSSLLAISVLTYFRRNYDLINKYFPTIQLYAASPDRCVCMAASRVICFSAEENTENKTFLRQIVETASGWLKSSNKDKLIFNALTILNEVGKILPQDVFNVTMTFFFPEIWSAVCSTDHELRHVAINVTQIHLQNMPHHSSDPFAEFCFRNCVQTIQTKSAPLVGPVLSCRTLYHVSPGVIDVGQMIDLLHQIIPNSDYELTTACFDFLVELASDSKYFTIQLSKKTIMLLRMAINRFQKKDVDLFQLIKFLSDFISRLDMDPSLISSVINSVELIVQDSSLKELHDPAFNALATLLDKYKDVVVPLSVFQCDSLCPGYLKSLSKQRMHIPKLKQVLTDSFAVLLQKKSKSSDSILCLQMVSEFSSDVFNEPDVIFEIIRHLAFSDDKNVRIAMANTLPVFKLHEANEELLRLAIYDQSKQVRLAALLQLSEEDSSELIVQLLSDPSYSVRAAAIPRVAAMAKKTPFSIVPTIIDFVHSFIVTNVCCSRDTKRSAKSSELLPLIAEHFCPYTQSSIPIIGWVCVHYLLHGDPFPQPEPVYVRTRKQSNVMAQIKASNYKVLDLRDAIHRDFVNITKEVQNERSIYFIENERWFEYRDEKLFQTLGVLASSLQSFIFQIIPVFVKTFSNHHTDAVYLAALKALRNFVRAFDSKLKFISLFPDIVPVLLQLLSSYCSKTVAVAILKTLAFMGACYGLKHQITNEVAVDHLMSFKQPSFLTVSVMDALLPLLKQPTPSVLEAVTTIMSRETQYALKYIVPVLKTFVEMIKVSKGSDLELLFCQLEIIVMAVGAHITPHISMLIDELKNKISLLSCMRVCATMSYELKAEFKPYATILYPYALKLMTTDDKEYLKTLLRFIGFTLLYQHTSIDMFLEQAQRVILLSPKMHRTKIILNSISMLIQQVNVDIYASRIAQICFHLIPIDFSKQLQQLLLNLILFANLNPVYVETMMTINHVTLPYINEAKKALENGIPSLDDVHFIKNQKPVPCIDHLTHIICSSNIANTSVFKNFPRPSFNNTKKWIEDLCTHLVTHSPSISVQCCSNVINQSEQFRKEIFPIAFLSCWKPATKSERASFSNMVLSILQSYDTVDSAIFYLIEILDKCGMPLEINDNLIASASKSSALSLYFLQRYVRNHPTDKKSIEELLTLSSRMGLQDSARGLLVVKGSVIGSEAGRWNEELGEWEKALEIYEKDGGKTDKLRCYAHLEQWEEIRKSEDSFRNYMTTQEQNDNAIWFAWAFFHSQDYEKASEYVKYFNTSTRNIALFRAIFLVASGQYESASKHIESCFESLTENREIYSGSDTNQASKNLVFAQHLTELQEVIEIKQRGIKEVPAIWQQRLHSFSTESDAWTKLIEIRNLLLSPSEHMDACLKLINVLRKERNWRLIDAYLGRLFTVIGQPVVVVSLFKIMWARGEKVEAINAIRCLNSIIEGKETQFPPAIAKTLQSAKEQIERNGVSQQFKSKALRIQATWEYRLYKAKTASSESLTDIINTFKRALKLNSEDYKIWSGWAYASSRALSHQQSKRALFAADAITAFLKSTQLRPSESLEFLCQLFSILVRYGEDIELPPSVKQELVSLPPSIVIQIIPQIVVHIAHHDKKVRNLVQEIICNFSDEHFEAVVYPLSVLSLLEDESKSPTAAELLEKLGSKHPTQYKDATIFISGMRRCAVSANERWITALDCAVKLHQQGDRKGACALIQKQYDLLNKPECEEDRIFSRNFTILLKRVKDSFDRYKAGDTSVTKPMWDAFRSIFAKLEERMKHADVIQLSKNSKELSTRRGYSISIPGTYSVDGNSPTLDYIGETLQVFCTQQHPRCVNMYDTTGKSWKFLLKGNEDLRLDQRIMQFFYLINTLLKSNRVTQKLGMSIAMYPVIPFAPNAGLISWFVGADTMQQLVSDYRQMRDIPGNLETEITQKFASNFNLLNSIQKIEVYQKVCNETKGDELRETLWLRSPTPSAWVEHSHAFTVSTALMSMAGYAIGLGDRHPSNIMVQRHTGRVIHIDFGDSFEVTRRRKFFPELVPFRLTRMIIAALDGGSVEGLFRRSCEDILYVLREHQSPVIAQLEIFVHEPIFGGSGQKAQHNTLSRVATKLSGTDSTESMEVCEPMDTQEQVSMLINVASDYRNYIRHFVGWCPFW